jgi:N-acetylmuramoyl-L-alanine amidase
MNSNLLLAGLLSLAACAEPTLTDEQQIIALTLLAEARGEGVEGMEAVAMVIKQRMANRKQTASQVCLAPKQFSCWNGKTSDDLHHLWQSPAAPDAIKVVRRFDELDPAVIDYADHYCAVNIQPFWAIVQVPVVVIGNHTFYRLKQ